MNEVRLSLRLLGEWIEHLYAGGLVDLYAAASPLLIG